MSEAAALQLPHACAQPRDPTPRSFEGGGPAFCDGAEIVNIKIGAEQQNFPEFFPPSPIDYTRYIQQEIPWPTP